MYVCVSKMADSQRNVKSSETLSFTYQFKEDENKW